MTDQTAYRSEVVGSLLRPAYLANARKQYESGQLGAVELKKIEDRAVDEAITLQEAAGCDVVTDGEMRRYAFYGHFTDAFDGYDRYGGIRIPFRNEQGEQLAHPLPVLVDRLKWRRSMCAEEWVYLRARASHPIKMTMVDATLGAGYYDPVKSKSAYANFDEYMAELIDFCRREIDELVRLGCTYIQIDAPHYMVQLDPQWREEARQHGEDPDKTLARYIDIDNAIIDGHPGVIFAMHFCRGNNQSMFAGTGNYELVSQIFTRSHFQRFLLEYDDERSGGFEPLRHVPDDRFVVLGLVSSKKPQLESPKELKQRIKEATRYIPLERLALSPQCGFASTQAGNRLTIEEERHKLELVTQVAREIWGA